MVIVMLWRDHRGGYGHASLALTRPRQDGQGNENVAVITWFSVGQVGTSSKKLGDMGRSIPNTVDEEWKTFMLGGGTREAYVQGLPKGHGLSTEFKPPSNFCRISTMSDQDALIGLSDANILSWWGTYKTRETYNVLTRNCSTAVAGALIAGGGVGFASPPGFLSSIWTPTFWTPEKVFQWATQIQSKVEPVNNRYREASATIEANTKGIDETEVWDVETWKKNSSIAMAHRYQVLKDIDTNLKEYHEMRQRVVRESGPAMSEAELPGLGKILDKIRQQMAERPTSSRRAAVLHLGKQVLNRINAIKWELTREQREEEARQRAQQAEQDRIKRERELEEERRRLEELRMQAMREHKAAEFGYDKLLADVNEKIAALKAEHNRGQIRLMTAFLPMNAKLQKVLTPALPKEQVDEALGKSVLRRRMGLELLMKALGAEERKAKEIQALIDKIE